MSQIDTQEKTIGVDTYKITMLDPEVARRLLLDLGKIFGPSLSVMVSSVVNAKDSKKALNQLMDGVDSEGVGISGEKMERAMLEFFNRADADKQDEIVDILSRVTSVKKGENWPQLDSVYSVHFRGRVAAQYKWLAFALQAQYGNFS